MFLVKSCDYRSFKMFFKIDMLRRGSSQVEVQFSILL